MGRKTGAIFLPTFPTYQAILYESHANLFSQSNRGAPRSPRALEDSCFKRCDAVLSIGVFWGLCCIILINLHSSQTPVPNPQKGTGHQSSMSSCWCDMVTWASIRFLNEAETLTLSLGPLPTPQLLTSADGHPLCLGQSFWGNWEPVFSHTHN